LLSSYKREKPEKCMLYAFEEERIIFYKYFEFDELTYLME
jgi:hypothetical protein